MHFGIVRRYVSELSSRWDLVASLARALRVPCVDLAAEEIL